MRLILEFTYSHVPIYALYSKGEDSFQEKKKIREKERNAHGANRPDRTPCFGIIDLLNASNPFRLQMPRNDSNIRAFMQCSTRHGQPIYPP